LKTCSRANRQPMRRRDFIWQFDGAVVARPLSTRAQKRLRRGQFAESRNLRPSRIVDPAIVESDGCSAV
jgi:hypothetical protein